MAREEKMQALVHYSKKLEPLPERFRDVDRGQLLRSRVPDARRSLSRNIATGQMHFYADLNVRQSPTIAAFLAILFAAINDQPPATTLAIPGDFVQQLMEGIGLSGREVGLNAMVARIKALRARDERPRAARRDRMTEAELDDLLSDAARRDDGRARAPARATSIVLGAGGKMGPTLARMARPRRRMAAVASSPCRAGRRRRGRARAQRRRRRNDRAATCSTATRSARLPDAPTWCSWPGRNSARHGAPAMTWGMNTLVPANCAERYRESRIVAFSTGNVYPLTPVASGGSRETGLARSRRRVRRVLPRPRTRVRAVRRAIRNARAIVRLNYAIDLRYGVLVDIALRVRRGEPVSVGHGIRERHLAGRRQPRRARVSAAGVGAAIRRQRHRARNSSRVRAVAEWFARRFGTTAQLHRHRTRPTRCSATRLACSPRSRRTRDRRPLRDDGARGRLGGARTVRCSASQPGSRRAMENSELPSVREHLRAGQVIPAHPLALTAAPPARRTAAARPHALLCRRRRRRRRGWRAHDAVRDSRFRRRTVSARCSSWRSTRCERARAIARPFALVAGVVRPHRAGAHRGRDRRRARLRRRAAQPRRLADGVGSGAARPLPDHRRDDSAVRLLSAAGRGRPRAVVSLLARVRRDPERVGDQDRAVQSLSDDRRRARRRRSGARTTSRCTPATTTTSSPTC